MGNAWDFYKKQQQMRRAKRVPERGSEILLLRRRGFNVQQMSASHFVVNGCLDLYPVHNQWYDRATDRRGVAKNLADFVKGWAQGQF